MRKVVILGLVVMLLLSLLPSGCTRQKPVVAPLLPPGFEQSRVPDVDLDGFLYVAQDSPFVLPWVDIYPPMEELLVCLSPTASTEATWIKASFESPSQAESAYQEIVDSENVWKLNRQSDLFVIHSEGFTAEPLVRAINQNDFVIFKKAYRDVWELLNHLPANPPGEAVAAGFLKPNDNFRNWLLSLLKDEQPISTFAEILDKVKIETIAIGLYSQADLNLIGKGGLEDSGLSILLVGKSSYPGFVVSIISQVLSWIGMTEDRIDGEKVYSTTFDNIHLVLKNVGSHVYLSIAPSSGDAKELLGSAIGEQVLSPPSPPPVSEDVEWLAKVIASEAGSVWDNEWVRCSDKERSTVGWTVLNRLEAGTFGKSIKEVVTAPEQYAHNQEPTSKIRELAKELLEGDIPDPTGGATHFFSPIGMPKEGESTTGFDTGGGLHEVPGIAKKVYFPSWTETYTWVGDLNNIRRAYFMFYRATSTPPSVAAGKKELLESLVSLKGAMLEKLDSDIDVTAMAFTNVKDYWRTKRWADIFIAPLRILEDTLSLLAKADDVRSLASLANASLDNSEAVYQVLSTVMMLQDLREVGEKLHYGLDGPTYVSSIKSMLEAADATYVPPFGSDWQKHYMNVIENHLYGVAEDTPLVIPRKSTEVERKNIEFARGALQVRTSIAKTFNDLIAEIENSELPEDFPTDEVVIQLNNLQKRIVKSMGYGTEVRYESYFQDKVETNLGAVGDLYRVFGQVAGMVDKELAIDTTVEVLKLIEAGESAALLYTVTYKIPSVKEEIKVAQKANTLAQVIIHPYTKTFSMDVEEKFYMIPQEMLLSFPTELSNLWMIADDTEQYVRYLLSEPTALTWTTILEDKQETRDWQDVKYLKVGSDGDNLYVRLEYSDKYSGGAHGNRHGSIFLDTDCNLETGLPWRNAHPWQQGAEYEIRFTYSPDKLYCIYGTLYRYGQDGNREHVINLKGSQGKDSVEVTVPINQIGSSKMLDIYVQSWAVAVDELEHAFSYTVSGKKSIIVDGNMADWSGISPILKDKAGDVVFKSADAVALYTTDDALNLYHRMDTSSPPLSMLISQDDDRDKWWQHEHRSHVIEIYYDVDQNPTTKAPNLEEVVDKSVFGGIGPEYRLVVDMSVHLSGKDVFVGLHKQVGLGWEQITGLMAAWNDVLEVAIPLTAMGLSKGVTIDLYVPRYVTQFIDYVPNNGPLHMQLTE